MTAGRTSSRGALLATLLALSAMLTGASCGNDGIPPPHKRECIENRGEMNEMFTYYACAYWGRCRVPDDPWWRTANRYFENHDLETTKDCRERFAGEDMFGLGEVIQDGCLLWDCFDAMVNASCDRPPMEELCTEEVPDFFSWREFPLECIPALERLETFLELCQPHDESVFWWRR